MKYIQPELIFIFLVLFTATCLGDTYKGNCFITTGSVLTSESFQETFHKKYLAGAGFVLDCKKDNWPVSIAFDSTYMYGRSTETVDGFRQAITFIASGTGLGVRKLFPVSKNVTFYLSGGLYFTRVYYELSGSGDTDAGIGYFASSGVYYRFFKNVATGIQWKSTHADVSVHNRSFNAGSTQLSFFVGFNY